MKRGILATIFFFFTSISSSPAQTPNWLRSRHLSPQNTAVLAVWADTGEPVVAYREKQPLNPASNVKLITSYCALKTLGPEHRFETRIFSETPLEHGALRTLGVQGEGDPSMVNESLLELVLALKTMGLKTVTGDILVDASYFDAQDYPGRQENNERAYNAPTSATPLNFNSVEIQVEGNRTKPFAQLIPNIPYLKLQSHLRVGGRGVRIFIDSKLTPHSEIISISGQIPRGMGALSFYRGIRRPPEFFAHTLKEVMRENGIVVDGQPRVGQVATPLLLFKWQSKPLRLILEDMNKFSNNFIAEQLTKYLGAKSFGPPGTTANGISVLNKCLQDSGIDTAGLSLENGSGLSYNNVVTAEQLVKVLLAGYHNRMIQNDFISSLSVNGVDGTMKSRRSPEVLEGVLRAKTGSLNGINSLAGFVVTPSGKMIAFAILMNHFRGNIREAHRIQDALVLGWLPLKR